MTDYAGLIPVNVITGFLGSGKTTLLTRLLRSPKLSDTVVLINEFGEVGLDHHLVEHVAESTLLLENGCLCCAIRGDLQESLRDLFSKRERGDIPAFRRVVIETSGLADPVPIAFTILSEPVLQHHYRLGNIITTIARYWSISESRVRSRSTSSRARRGLSIWAVMAIRGARPKSSKRVTVLSKPFNPTRILLCWVALTLAPSPSPVTRLT